MLLRPFIFTFFILFFTGTLWSQNPIPLKVEGIDFEGLNRTRENHLRSFLQIKIGTPLSGDSLLQADLQRLKNTPSIGKATYRLDTLEGQKVMLTFSLEERKTFLPIVNFGGIRNNFWFQLGFTDINWRGKGQHLEAYYQNNDRRHNGQIFYRVPYFKKSLWGYSASLRKYSSVEPLYFTEGEVRYNYDNYSLGFTGIRHFNYEQMLEFGGTLFREDYAQSAEQVLSNPPGPSALQQNKLLLKIAYSQNQLEYNSYNLRRYVWLTQLQGVYNFSEPSWFHTFHIEYRQFWRPFIPANIALRLRLGISTNNDTPFAPFVVDSNVNLRGVGNRIDRGTAQATLNVEYRHAVYDKNNWAVQFIAFSDIGTWRNPGGQLKDLVDPDQFRQFVGGGIRVIYKKVHRAILRVDYGIDVFDVNQKGLVLGVGQYF